eukprot:CAMPEP_0175141878 /NCGR_PEP_ID=MMETSP0087-20121206/12397_1 /TAXON_ID=136419 /ORGANISM="Unknown Unknown, Strain D1" /LENGTH=572 /DNA_ID=CAMNT_0016425437 /DNA_START=83 /DNA_END=1798 /DNA_ORIENTATION=-
MYRTDGSINPQRLALVLSVAVLLLWLLSGTASTTRRSSDVIEEFVSEPHIVVIGTGPTGLGAAWRLHELGYKNFTVVESTSDTGGLAKSVVDNNGFTWDHGVHVLFSHFTYFDSMLDMALPNQEDWFHHNRSSPAWMRNRFVGYPVQNNVWQLPEADLMECLDGLVDLTRTLASGNFSKPANFKEWVDLSFGAGIGKQFMHPYNFKVWAHTTEKLNTQWVGERVATVDPKKILHNLVYKVKDVTWGPNAVFRYPKHGSGHIWDALIAKIPKARIFLGKRVTALHTGAGKQQGGRKLSFADGTSLQYDRLVSTMPIDKLLRMSDSSELRAAGSVEGAFKYQTVNLVGIGIEGNISQHLSSVQWVYFPEEEFVFYRLTVLSNFSPYMVKKPYQQYSIVCEVSESKYRVVDQSTIVEDVVRGLKKSGFVQPDAVFATKWHERFEYGYPVPYVGRDEHVHHADELLQRARVWSRGRFGSWKYEVANQDHSFMLGVQAVNNILFGAEETTFRSPNTVNAKLHQWPDEHVKPPIPTSGQVESPPFTPPPFEVSSTATSSRQTQSELRSSPETRLRQRV